MHTNTYTNLEVFLIIGMVFPHELSWYATNFLVNLSDRHSANQGEEGRRARAARGGGAAVAGQGGRRTRAAGINSEKSVSEPNYCVKRSQDTELPELLQPMSPAPVCPATSARPPALQITGGPDFGDGQFQHGADVTVHGVANLAEGLRARVIAWDQAASLYVVRDEGGQVWGLRAEKLRPLAVLELSAAWTPVHAHEAIPRGAEVCLNLETGARMARQVDPRCRCQMVSFAAE